MAQACVMRSRQEERLFTPGKPPMSPQQDTSLITSTVRKRKVGPASPLPHAQPAADEGKRRRTPPVDRGLAHGGDALVQVAVAPLNLPPGAAAAADAEQQHGQQAPGGGPPPRGAAQQQQGHGGGGEGDALFSPLFHLHKEAGGGGGELSACSVSEEVALDAAAAADEAQLAGGGELTRRAAAPSAPPGGAGAAALLVSPPRKTRPEQRPGVAEGSATSTEHSTGTSASLSLGLGCGGGGDGACSAACPPAVASPAPAAPPAPAVSPDADDADDFVDFDPLLFIKRLPPLERCVPPRRDFLLPRQTRRSKQKTLVLDLDETLVHSTLDGYCRPDFTFPVEVGSMRHMVGVRQRPHLHTFLERVARLYEVVVFTASQRVYAEQLLDVVDPGRRLVRHRVFRDSCVLWEGNYLKDLTVLGRDLAHTIIVDNSPQAFGFQLDNGIPIESWFDDDGDEELLKLIPFLEKVVHAEDVRPHIQKRYRLRSLVDSMADPDLGPCPLQRQH